MAKILILGGGLSALSAGIRLLEIDNTHDVTILCMEHRLGGKAASWRHPDNRYMEIGYHAVFGYYQTLRDLLAKVGRPVTDAQYFTSNDGVHLMYERQAAAINKLRIPDGPFDVPALLNNGFLTYEGMTVVEKMAAAKWLATFGAWLLTHAPEDVDPHLDEHSFTQFCTDQGLEMRLTDKSWFKYLLDLAFHFPHSGSAYVGAYGFRKLLGPQSSEVFYFNGPLSEVMIEPVAQHYVGLGGKIELCTKVVGIELDAAAAKIAKVMTAPMATPVPIPGKVSEVTPNPIGAYPLFDAPYPEFGEPDVDGAAPVTTRTLGAEFDEVICTLPVDSLRWLLRTEPNFDDTVWKHRVFRDIWHLRTVASLSMRVWSPHKLLPPDYTTVVMGTAQPAATVIDYTNRVDELDAGPWASVVEFEGQEGLHGQWRDDEIKRALLEDFAAMPFSMLDPAWIDDIVNSAGGFISELRRNTANHVRYLLMEPGHWKYRPDQTDRPYDNFTLAGDWVISRQPTASMEAAVQTGQRAAELL